MPSPTPRWQHRRTVRSATPDDSGFTLIELMVALLIGAIVMSLALSSMVTALTTGVNAVATGQANDKAQLALDLLQRQVVSANVIYNPATEGTNAGPTIPAGFSLRLFTTYKGTTSTCVQWRLTTTGALQYRAWPVDLPTEASKWLTEVSGLATTGAAPFSLTSTAAYGDRVLNVDLLVHAGALKSSSSRHTEIRSSFPAVDAEFYEATAPQFCTPPS